jgi:hypothetical protein
VHKIIDLQLFRCRDHDLHSAANEARDRNSPTNAVRIRLQASLIGKKDCAILPQLSARLDLRQGQEWLGDRHNSVTAVKAGAIIRNAVDAAFADGKLKTCEFGGTAGTKEVTTAVMQAIRNSTYE